VCAQSHSCRRSKRDIDRIYNLYTMASFNKTSASKPKQERRNVIGMLNVDSSTEDNAKQCARCG
jgi:hypothetical protein